MLQSTLFGLLHERSKKLYTLLIIILSYTIGSAQSTDLSIIDQLDDQIMQYIDDSSPGVAVGVIKEGETIYENYFGYANLEHQVKIDKQTRFNIASNAKQFTALCVLRLIEEGLLDLEDDIRKYLPDLYQAYPNKISVSNLIAHTSGIRDVYELWSLQGKTWWKLFIGNKEAIDLLRRQKDLNFKPSSDFLYSNSNYILLTEIISKVTGKSFEEYSGTLFKDLGLTETSYLTNYMEVIPHKARPYSNWNGWREYPSITETHGDGGLYTTLSDQLKWEKIIQLREGNNFSTPIINRSQSSIASSGTQFYGFGLLFDSYKGLDYSYHNGSTGAYNATFLRFIDDNTTIVVMTNNGNIPTNHLAKQLADIILETDEDDPPIFPADPEKVEEVSNLINLLGSYQHEDETIINISENNGSIYREIYQRDPIQLIQEKGGLFHYESNEDLKINFSNIGSQNQDLTIYLSSQQPYRYIKVENRNIDKDELNGIFYNEETDTEIIINYDSNNKFKIIKNGRERDGILIKKDLLRMMNSYKIRITRDKDLNITGLLVDNNRIKNVVFTKQ